MGIALSARPSRASTRVRSASHMEAIAAQLASLRVFLARMAGGLGKPPKEISWAGHHRLKVVACQRQNCQIVRVMGKP